ncbi:hypothetical protein EES47_03115 [Streptomyces sp. ADI98-12]|uniref:Uncharacterized protein n=1 Tax=Streptomyces griseus TaxID=1911 RepID=A0A380PCH8_STRGR|nr:hypothetical protein [Streptomyces sp. DSM 41037]RPK92668.1 hypothetical protein EES47_03115 [Streptomyces sp. ADI98-12]SUP62648.1 Uncharacterised protein [Streptomyces griseus]
MPARIVEEADHLLGQVPDQPGRARVAPAAPRAAPTFSSNDGG